MRARRHQRAIKNMNIETLKNIVLNKIRVGHMNLTVAAIVILILLPLGSPPRGEGETRNIFGVVPKPAETIVEPEVKDQDVATEARSEDAAAKAVRKAAHVSRNPRQMREEAERWAAHYARVYGVPVELVRAIIEQESGWNPHAVSNKGAAGLMQLMPATARRFGVHNRFGIRENIRGGVAYLAWLSLKCNGDIQLMSAAYYGGEYQLTSHSEHSAPDVQAYVKRVEKRYQTRQASEAPLAAGDHNGVSPEPSENTR